MNVIISSITRPPEEYPTVTTFSLWSVCSFFYYHLLLLYPPHLFAAYVTINFAKFNLPHQLFYYFFFTVFISLSAASNFFVLPSSVFLLFLYDMIEAKLGNELGILHALISCSCHLLVWRETNSWTSFRNMFLLSTDGPGSIRSWCLFISPWPH